MKFLVLFLILAISIQPLQAGICDMDMEDSHETSHHMPSTDDRDHDCCDSEEPDSQTDCGNLMHCGSCHASFSALPAIPRVNAYQLIQYSPALSSDALPASPYTPLLRPPIA